MVSLIIIVPLDMPGFGNEKHIILDCNLLVGYLTQKNLSRVEFFSKIYKAAHTQFTYP